MPMMLGDTFMDEIISNARPAVANHSIKSTFYPTSNMKVVSKQLHKRDNQLARPDTALERYGKFHHVHQDGQGRRFSTTRHCISQKRNLKKKNITIKKSKMLLADVEYLSMHVKLLTKKILKL